VIVVPSSEITPARDSGPATRKLLDGENLNGPLEDRVYSSARGPVRRLRFPVTIERNPLFWERLEEQPGASDAVWVTL
jgi:hypothetical protein